MKSGTTSLHQYLARHPQAFMCEPKEPGFFVEELTWTKGLDWYLSLFAAAGSARVIGEGSTHYTKLPTYRGVVERIGAFSPDARFIYVMRDPLERLVSHYWHNVRNLFLEAERRDLATAVAENPEYLAFGDYATQLQPYFDRFGRDRVYCVTFEALTSDPIGVCSDICGWLGLEGEIPRDVFSETWNARPAVIRQARGLGLLNRFAHSRLWGALSPLVPRRLRRAAGSLASETVTPSRDASAGVIELLRPQVRDQVAALSTLLGREFPEWGTVSGVARATR